MTIKIYIASKMHHAAKWRELRDDWKRSDLSIISTWIDHDHFEDKATPDDFMIFWITDHADVVDAEFLVLYGEEGDVLRGALVEAGMFLALDKHVIVVGDNPSYGTWKYHPRVIRVPTLESAKQAILYLKRKAPRR